MVYEVKDILRDVRIAIDENKTNEQLIADEDIDTLMLDDIITSKVIDGVKKVHSEAPVYLLDGGYNFGDGIYWGEMESGWCLLPDDFMRLVVFQMDDWERAVYHAISEDDKEYQLQSSRFKGVRGTAQRPVCAVAIRPEGRALEFYSCKSTDAKVKRAVYLPYPRIDEDNGVEICERCYQSVVYMIASLALFTCESTEQGKLLLELSKSALV